MNWLNAVLFLLGFGIASTAIGFTDRILTSLPLLIVGATLMYWSLP